MNSNVTLVFTPDYGSTFDHATIDGTSYSANSMTKVGNSYIFNWVNVTPAASSVSRVKKVLVQFNRSTSGVPTDGMEPEADDPLHAEFTENFEICGAQIKSSDENNKSVRFVSVIDKDILDISKEYGWVVGYTKEGTATPGYMNRNSYALVRNGSYGLTFDCTGTDNLISGDYGKADTGKPYKYITIAVNNVQDDEVGLDTIIIARPYVVLNDDSVIYGQYMDISTGEACCACSGSYNYIASLAGLQ